MTFFWEGCCVFLRSPSVMTYEVLGSSLTRYLNTLPTPIIWGDLLVSCTVAEAAAYCGLLHQLPTKGATFF